MTELPRHSKARRLRRVWRVANALFVVALVVFALR